MRSFFSLLILPLPLFWIMLTVAFVLHQKKNKIWPKRIFTIALIWLAAVTTPFLPELLVKNLENRWPVFSLDRWSGTEKPVHILVLGGGHVNDYRLPETSQLSGAALSRLTEGIRIYRQLPGSDLITSGFRGKEDVPQAKVLAEAAVCLGVEPTRIKMQTEPRNTWMEATEYKRLFGDSAQLILVTSAIHLPRAVYLFKKAGLHPMPAPAGYMVKENKKRRLDFWIPSSENIKRTEAVIHEQVGILWSKLGGN